jgi:DNA repair protein RecN (Recombination protein N)
LAGEASSGDGEGALTSLRRLRTSLETAASIDTGLSDLARRSDDAFYELEDVADSLRQYAGALSFRPERLEEVETRLAEIRKLKKKYGGSVEAVLARHGEDQGRLERLETWEEDKGEIERRIASMETEVLAAALAISDKRKQAASGLQVKIEAIIRTLGMPNAKFFARVGRKDTDGGKPVVGPFGVDEVEFLIAANQGESAKPLARIASGGELSRVALAAKTILAGTDSVDCLIFDEVDAGIGGEVAVAVGEHLKELGKARQVLCITHLASIAVRADNHYRVEKDVSGGRTSTRLSRMDGRARAEEIARMLAGDPREEASIAHATELLRKYGNWRDS